MRSELPLEPRPLLLGDKYLMGRVARGAEALGAETYQEDLVGECFGPEGRLVVPQAKDTLEGVDVPCI